MKIANELPRNEGSVIARGIMLCLLWGLVWGLGVFPDKTSARLPTCGRAVACLIDPVCEWPFGTECRNTDPVHYRWVEDINGGFIKNPNQCGALFKNLGLGCIVPWGVCGGNIAEPDERCPHG